MYRQYMLTFGQEKNSLNGWISCNLSNLQMMKLRNIEQKQLNATKQSNGGTESKSEPTILQANTIARQNKKDID